MKSVLISIQPKWCELIASGKKTVEVRKTRPKIDTPFKCYIYCTQGKDVLAVSKYPDKSAFLWKKSDVDRYNADMVRNGKVIGEFVCDRIRKGTLTVSELCDSVDMGYDATCLTVKDIKAYLGMEYVERKGNYRFYGWRISDLVIYDKPKELSEFVTICVNDGLNPYKCGKCEYYYSESYEVGVYEECCCNNLKPLKRPPQSWYYVTEQ